MRELELFWEATDSTARDEYLSRAAELMSWHTNQPHIHRAEPELVELLAAFMYALDDVRAAIVEVQALMAPILARLDARDAKAADAAQENGGRDE